MKDRSNAVLVTGGAGYIGSALVPALLGRGYRVRVFDQLLYGDAGLAGVRDQIELIEGDVRTFPPEILDDISAVINLAGLSAEPAAEYRPEANRQINTLAAVHIATLAREHGVARFIQASSCSNYDVGAGHPEKDILHTEDFPVQPFRIYSISKFEAEQGILALNDTNFCPVVFRKGSVYGYGPRLRMDLVVNTFVYKAIRAGSIELHNGGEMWRPLLSIDDAVDAYLLAIAAPPGKVRGQIYNIVNGNYRISELALRVQHALAPLGIQCKLRPDYEYRNLRSCQASGKKAIEQLGFRPRVTVEQSAVDLAGKFQRGLLDDIDHPMYHNIRWLDALEDAKKALGIDEPLFDLSPAKLKEVRVAATTQKQAAQ